jgi:ADP-heptose:LPS heptosyltransferase
MWHLSGGRGSTQQAFSVSDILKAPGRILVIPDGRPGGIFLGASQIWAIRQRYPDAQISLLVQAEKEYIAQEFPFVDEVVVFEEFLLPFGGKQREVVRQLRGRNFDIAFCFSTEENICPATLCYKSGAQLRVGFQRDDFPFFNVRIVPKQEVCSELDRLALILNTLGIPQVKERVSWSVSREGAKRIRDRFLVGKRPGEQFVGLDVSTSGVTRPSDKQLLAVAEALSRLDNTRLLVFFDVPGSACANRVREVLGQRSLLFQTDELPRLVALLEACSRIFAPNSDVFHLAVSKGLPTTGFLARQDVVRWVPGDLKNLEILDLEAFQSWNATKIRSAVERSLSAKSAVPAAAG